MVDKQELCERRGGNFCSMETHAKDDMLTEQGVFDALRYQIRVDHWGTRKYYNTAGQLHRENGPAVENPNGDKFWYQNNYIHRTDGPAIEWRDGGRLWYQNGVPHRMDGAAVERADGTKEWYINGEELTEAEFNQRVKSL